ncbi:MAG: hypothetical protein C5B49_01925 [Bdellovibrio sp.]|nr:MAG: hypothetical protein C5B49_01925 [Bdellovibrio sp.]
MRPTTKNLDAWIEKLKARRDELDREIRSQKLSPKIQAFLKKVKKSRPFMSRVWGHPESEFEQCKPRNEEE